MTTPVIATNHLHKSFVVGKQRIPILKDITFEIEKGDFILIFGPSGCGKSTLLHSILGLEIPTSGSVQLFGRDLYAQTTEDDRNALRKKYIGMVFQQPNWVKSLTVVENVGLPLQLLGHHRDDAVSQALTSLQTLGVEEYANYIPTELSSGQQQKVALARAITTNSPILIADEPTGNLDYQSGQELMARLAQLNAVGKTIVMVSHDLEYIRYAKTIIQMLDGQIINTYHEHEKDQLMKQIQSKRGV